MSKAAFGDRVRDVVDQLAVIADATPDILAFYFDRGYNSGGANQIADGDLSSVGITAAQLVNAIVLLQQFDKLVTNQATTTADYGATLNDVRRSVP